MTTAPVVPTGPSPGAAGAPGVAKTSGLAIASLVAGILGLCTAGLGGIAGLVLGIIALRKIRRSGGALRGRGLAIAGLIVSVCTVLVWVLAAVVVGVLLLPPSSKEVEEDRSPVKRAAAPAVAQPALAAPTAAAPAELTLDLGGGVTMKMVLIPAGKFMMGSPDSAQGPIDFEVPQHEVILSKPFYMGVTEVTQAQYQAVMGKNPSEFKGATNPVETVSWNDATEFCKKLSEKAGQAVRLPTEAEWEYPCRAGTQTAFSFGDDLSALGDYAWWDGNSDKTTHPVGQKKPNSWGLYDMHGNVWEWCADWYGEYPKGPVTDPSGPATGYGGRVLRGGAWYYGGSDYFRCAFRHCHAPTCRDYFFFGFRCARTL
ncbi:MAG: SUMF1/EgtB/PvdO family nonheme iron enzyme [Planctomycetota bacterium]|nr:SUMF1/EgtB/PvdO family nonheme iron enzyme [Planctomycetota bacterium]